VSSSSSDVRHEYLNRTPNSQVAGLCRVGPLGGDSRIGRVTDTRIVTRPKELRFERLEFFADRSAVVVE
jgi:hypothetical protein